MESVKLKLSAITCHDEILKPNAKNLVFNVDENVKVMLMNESGIKTIFGEPRYHRCQVSRWFLTAIDSEEEMKSGDEFKMFVQHERKYGMEPLYFDPNLNLK